MMKALLDMAGRIWERLKSAIPYLAEISVLTVWAMWVGREYLDFDPNTIPHGAETGSSIHAHFFWNWLRDCGACAAWNGSLRGGYPAFAEIHSATFHPLTFLTVWLWGVVNGAKVGLVVLLWVAGMAQLWLGHLLGVNRVARIWTALLAVTGGHLLGRMDLGAYMVMSGVAFGSLVAPALLYVYKKRNFRSAAVLGLATGSAALAGSGYMQLGVFMLLPASLFLLFDDRFKLQTTVRYYMAAALLALLLSAVILVPLSQSYNLYQKPTDPDFAFTQPIRYLVLNLVIDDLEFYRFRTLERGRLPYLYVNFIGWLPVILAVIGLFFGRTADRRVKWFLLAGIASTYAITSGWVLRNLVLIYPGIAAVRNAPQIASMAVPLLLGVAALGLDYLWRQRWPEVSSEFNQKLAPLVLSLRWLLVIPLAFSLRATYNFIAPIAVNVPLLSIQQDVLDTFAEHLPPGELAWVQTPRGAHRWVTQAIGQGFKISNVVVSITVKDQPPPEYRLEARFEPLDEGHAAELIAQLDSLHLYQHSDAIYAGVRAGESVTPCRATGVGGHIEVFCDTLGGELIVQENVWIGWRAWLDGEPAVLSPSNDWLRLPMPPGQHQVTLRYEPRDVPIGIGLTALGLVLCIGLLL